jgi:uncharacterized protein YjbI with pentapeptide repeats
MAIYEQSRLLSLCAHKNSATDWNNWRNDNPNIEVDLSKLELSGNFDVVNLSGVNLSVANLKISRFNNANMSGANFSGANLENSGFSKCNLTGANFKGANIAYSKYEDVDFSHADLSNVDFLTVTFAGKCRFDQANVSGARFPLVYTNWFTPDQFRSMRR